MKRKRYTEEQIISFPKAHENGAKVSDLVRQHRFSEHSFYRRKSKYGDIEVSYAKRLREFEQPESVHRRLPGGYGAMFEL